MSALAWLDPGTVSALGWTLVNFFWQGAAAAALLAMANSLLQGRPPRARYGVALALLVAMLAAPVATFVAVRDAAPAQEAPLVSEVTAPLPPPAESLAPTIARRPDAGAYLPALVAFWAGGVLILSLRTLGGWALLWRLRRSGRLIEGLQEAAAALARRMRISRPVRVCESLLVQVPTAMGWIKPLILLPPATVLGLSPAQLELVLAHELAHIRRLDPLVALLQAAAETLLFYHPAVWWVSHRLRVEREECCDDAAVAVCGNAVAYARALATVEELRLRAPRPVMALSGGSLGARVRRLVSPPDATSTARWPVALLVLLVAAAGVAPATLRAGAQGAEPSAPAYDEKVAAPAVERAAAPGALTPEEIIAMSQAGVTGDYASGLAELGYELSPDRLIALRQQGVTPDYVRELAEEGLRDLSPGALVQLRAQGVTPDYARELREAAGRPFSALELTLLRNQGVNPEDAAAFKASGHSLTAPRLAALRSQGVDADYVEELKALGYPRLSAAQLMALRSQGVTSDYVRELQELGYRGLTPGALISLRAMGVTPEWVRDLQEAGWKSLSTDELVTLRSQGFEPHGWPRQR